MNPVDHPHGGGEGRSPIGRIYPCTPWGKHALGVKTKKFFQFWKEDRPSIEDKLLSTLEPALKSFYNSEGFYDAKFTIKETNTTISVSVTENEPVKIRDINISSDYDISSLVTLQKDDIFKAKAFISIKTGITSVIWVSA